jgi:UDP-glucuronate decarboxylase
MVAPQRIAILGGAGFVGANLSRHLWKNGHEVVVIDDFSSGARDNLCDLEAAPRFELARGDVCSITRLEVDRIYVTAYPGSRMLRWADRQAAAARTLEIARSVLETAARTGARVLYASPGACDANPCPSVDHPLRCAEQLLLSRPDVDARVARLFNAYGPGMRDDDPRLIARVITRALRGEPVEVYGDGSQVRGFCYVDELGQPEELTVSEVARRVLAWLGGGKLSHVAPREDDAPRRVADISRAAQLFGFCPRVGLDDGLPPTLRYFEELLGSGSAGFRAAG